MRFMTILCSGLLCGVAGSAMACEMSTLVAIPAKDQIAGKEDQIRADANSYFTGMQAYVACIQAELTAAASSLAQHFAGMAPAELHGSFETAQSFVGNALGEANAAGGQPDRDN